MDPKACDHSDSEDSVYEDAEDSMQLLQEQEGLQCQTPNLETPEKITIQNVSEPESKESEDLVSKKSHCMAQQVDENNSGTDKQTQPVLSESKSETDCDNPGPGVCGVQHSAVKLEDDKVSCQQPAKTDTDNLLSTKFDDLSLNSGVKQSSQLETDIKSMVSPSANEASEVTQKESILRKETDLNFRDEDEESSDADEAGWKKQLAEEEEKDEETSKMDADLVEDPAIPEPEVCKWPDLMIDEEQLKADDETLTAEEKEVRRAECQDLKNEANVAYKGDDYEAALSKYTEALNRCPLEFKKDRAVLFSNRAATLIQQKRSEPALVDCTSAVELHPTYPRALRRRADLYEKADKLEEALEDWKKVLELEPSDWQARSSCMRLPDEIKERNEKLKEEMIGKLKDLGNLVLRPFGLSTNNFSMTQDPTSGGYSMSFNQNSSG